MLSGAYAYDLAPTDTGQAPLGDCLGAERAALLKNVDRHNQSELPHANVHSAVSNFIFWRFVNERRQTLPHTQHSLLSEQGGNVALGLNVVNPFKPFNFSRFSELAS